MKKIYPILSIALLSLSFQSHALEQWRGLTVEPENRCSEYNKKRDYHYSQSVEDIIVQRMGGKVYGPYTGRYFKSDKETDIEHMVATSEAHDSGLCKASKATRVAFASDQLNLTLASPEVNRCGVGGKCGFDATRWLPEKNKCWFSNVVLEVKTKYSLSVDAAEARELESVLSKCDNFDMVFYENQGGDSYSQPTTLKVKAFSFAKKYLPSFKQGSDTPDAAPAQYAAPKQEVAPVKEVAPVQELASDQEALNLYDDNKNGRITCLEARAHGIAPVTKEHAAYPFMRDSDGDGVVCE